MYIFICIHIYINYDLSIHPYFILPISVALQVGLHQCLPRKIVSVYQTEENIPVKFLLCWKAFLSTTLTFDLRLK